MGLRYSTRDPRSKYIQPISDLSVKHRKSRDLAIMHGDDARCDSVALQSRFGRALVRLRSVSTCTTRTRTLLHVMLGLDVALRPADFAEQVFQSTEYL
jgi:hypothetical protein